MRHAVYLGKAVILVTLIFTAVNHLAYPLLKAAIGESKFRAVVAVNAAAYLGRGQRVVLFIGNSRIMGGIDPASVMSGGDGRVAYNLAYNGLYLDDLQLMLNAFIQSCDCRVEYVYANPDIFLPRLDGREISELQRFFSALDPVAMQALAQTDPVSTAAMRLFPLLHFNNEFFLRALYYRLTGKDDQDYGSDFTFAITREVENRLAAMRLDSGVDSRSVEKFRLGLAASGIALVLIEPPYHKVYIDKVPGFARAHSGLKNALAETGVRYLDHSGLFLDSPELFADPIHLNRAGQRKYSRYLLHTMPVHDAM